MIKALIGPLGDSKETVVCDYIGAMTDRFALTVYEDLFVPKTWHG